ncbi:MAG: hypothetical protein H7X99_00335 [Saprospiraceae bacterium]|nr:hypothetical protein [Saprospiraceae bacterium]
MRFLFLFIIFSGLFLASCHKDETTFNDAITSVFTAKIVKEINGTIVGYVYDDKNQPVHDATVLIYSTSIKTNKHGVFVFKNVRMDQQGTYIKVIKKGFILGSDMVYPNEAATTYSYTKLLTLDNNKIIESENGGTVSVTGGAEIIFPNDAFVTSNGNSYIGKVSVTAKYINPNDPELGNVMPGGLIADAANGNTVVLGTLGMVAVELRDDHGNELLLKPSGKAIIRFPAVTSTKPSEIKLWSFDENKGWWKEEGLARLLEDHYVAEVSHFSFWNCDAPFPLVDVCGKVLYEDGTAAVNIGIRIEVDGLGTGFGSTNSNGEFCGKMPKGKVLKIKISHYNCIGNIHEVTVGPFQNNTVLDNIFINVVPSFVIRGNLHCNGSLVDDGIAVIKVKESTIIFESSEDGTFEFDLTNYLCGDQLPVSIFGFDNSSTETSGTITVTNPNAGQVDLNVCDAGCGLTGTIAFDCHDKITVSVSNGSGTYTYKWNDNVTLGATLIVENADSLVEGGLFCVTVTDVTANCEKVFCKQVKGKPFVFIRNACGDGILAAQPYGGVEPYTYLWDGGNTSKDIIPSAIATYCLTVTDFNGCTGTGCISYTGPLSIDATPVSCNANNYNFTSTPFIQGSFSGSGTNVGGNVTYPIVIDIFKSLFNFKINIYGNQCETSVQVVLPHLKDGLTAIPVHTSCPTCNDGKININLIAGAECYLCQTGPVKVFKTSDVTTDISSDNNAGILAKGEYYVVVTDINTGCYIAYKKVKVE